MIIKMSPFFPKKVDPNAKLKTDLETSVTQFINELKIFEKYLNDNPINMDRLFVQYDKIKAVKHKYLELKDILKKKLDDKYIDNNLSIIKFKKYRILLEEHEKRLLILGVNLKTKELTTNESLLNQAFHIEKESVNKLKSGLMAVEETKKTAFEISKTLEEDREKIKYIGDGLDSIDSELVIAQKRITNFAKRIYTDKIIIAGTALAVGAISTVVGLGLAGVVPVSGIAPIK
jgi:hypothetical protein